MSQLLDDAAALALKNFLKGMETREKYDLKPQAQHLKNFLKGMETNGMSASAPPSIGPQKLP